MVSATLTDHLLQLVVWVSIVLLGVMLLLVLLIARLRINLIARTAREQRFLEIWRPLLAAAIVGETGTIPPLKDGEEIFFLKLWNHLHESLRGKAKRQLNLIALRCDVLRHAYALLGNKDLHSQLLALTTLGHLGDRSAWRDILKLAQTTDPLRSLSAVRALFQIDARAVLHDLGQALIEREDWPTAQLAIMIHEAGEESIYAVLADTATRLANSTDPALIGQLNRVLHLLEIAPHSQVMPAIRAILVSAMNDEIIAQCLKFLREPNELPLVRRHLKHPSWTVRLQAVRALGRVGTTDDLPKLEMLLGDPVWWVRYRTAQALVALTRGNFQVLDELRERLADPYARDMLKMAMSEKEGE